MLVFALGIGVGVASNRLWTQPAPQEAPADVYASVRRSVVALSLEAPEARVGAGVVVGPHEILTARHLVVDAVGPILVRDTAGLQHEATVSGTDARVDLALLTVRATLVPATLNSGSHPRVGDTLLAVGNPFGLEHSLSVGVLSAMERKLDRSDGPRVGFLQLSIPLNPGNSGGPLFDLHGRVVGLLTGTHTQGQAIAFAVPVEEIEHTLPALREGKHISRAFLGVRTVDTPEGVQVRSVIPSGPADVAGLRPGDLISAFDGQTITTTNDLYARLDQLEGGSRTSLRVFRSQQLQVLDVALLDWAEQPVVIAGMTLRPAPGAGGVVVAVRPRSRADGAGIQVDDVVRTVNGLPMRAPADVKDALQEAASAQLEVQRAGASLTLTL